MENLLNQISSNPLYLAIAVVLGIILAVGIAKKIIKLIIILAIALIAFAAYLHFTGQEFPTDTDNLKSDLFKQVGKVKDSASEALDETLKSAKDDFSKELKRSRDR